MYEAILEHSEIDGRILGQVWRMHAAWEREASLQLRAGDTTAVGTYAGTGRVVSADGLHTVLDSFTAAARDGEEVLVTAYTNRYMDQLNAAMRARLYPDRDPTGEWSETWNDEGTEQELRLGIGDLIRTRENWSQGRTNLGRAVVNGATWIVEAITGAGVWSSPPERGRALLNARYLTDRRLRKQANTPGSKTGRGFPHQWLVDAARGGLLMDAPWAVANRSIDRYGSYHTAAAPQLRTSGCTVRRGASSRLVKGSGGWAVG